MKTATIKQVIIYLSKVLKFIFRKKNHFVVSLVKKWKVPTKIRAFNFTTVDHPVYWTFKVTLSSIRFERKESVDLLVSEFFLCCDLSMIMFSLGKGFRFPSV